jgi:DNA-binding CsgD family transcriptional regulator/tetratricopeptide (TPR) repeat protein
MAMTSSNERSSARGFESRPQRRLWSERFVGRERALERVAFGLQSAVDGKPSAMVLSGTAGLGISRLLAETERRIGALAEPFATLHGVAMPATAGIPYAPIGTALEGLLVPADDELLAELVGPTGDVIARLVPGLRPRMEALGLLPDRLRVVATEWREARMFEAVLGLLERLGKRRPVALMLEDMHHADAATRGLGTFLARVSRGQRVLLVMTYQPDRLLRSHPLRATLTALAGTPSVVNAEIPPLDRVELAELVEAIEGGRPSSTTLLLVAERSHGNPLVAEEVLAARRELSAASLAASFERLVTARAALRSLDCRRVLRLLSMAGSPVTWPALLAMATEFERHAPARVPRPGNGHLPGDGLESEIQTGAMEGLEHGFLVETADGRLTDQGRERRIGFRHELIAEAVAADLLPGLRRRFHAALAAAGRPGDGVVAGRPVSRPSSPLSGIVEPPNPATELVHHLAAGELVEAQRTALAAAAAAEALDAGADALAHYETALSLYDIVRHDGDPPRQPDLYVSTAEAAFAAGDPARASAYCEAAAALLDAPGERLALGLVMEQLGRYRRASGDHAGALSAYRRAVDLVPPASTPARARVLASLAHFHMLDGVFSEARHYAQEALAAARAAGDPARQELLHASCTLAVADAWGEEPEPAVAALRRMLHEAADLGRLDDLFRVYANLTTALDLLGRRDEAIAIAYQGIAEAEREGQATVYGNFLRANACDSLYFMGRWPEVRRLSLEALSWSPVGIWFLTPLHNLTAVEVAMSAGESAGRLLGQLLLAIETVRDPQFAVPAQQLAAAYALWQEDLVDASRAAERGWRRVADTEDWLLTARMAATCLEVDSVIAADAHRRRDLAALAGARERSLPIVLQAEAAVADSGVSNTIGSRRHADLAVRMARAFRSRIEGRDDPATWAGLAAGWADLGDPYEAAQCRWREAEALLDRSRGRTSRATAKEPLHAAAEGAYALGAWPLLRAVAELSRRALLPLPRPIEAALDGRLESRASGPRLGTVPAARPEGIASGDRVGTAGAGARGAPSGRGELATHGRGATGNAAALHPEPGLIASFAASASPGVRQDFGLSKREVEVLALIAEGRSNPEIGRQLYITRKTVAVHVSNILTKLGVSGRVEAAAAAIRLGLTERS